MPWRRLIGLLPLRVIATLAAAVTTLGGAQALALGGAQALAKPLPPMGSEPAPSLFGINTGTYDTSHPNYARDLPTARRLGARWVHFTAANVPLRRGRRLNFARLDYEVTRARRLGLGVLLSLAGWSHACSLRPRPANPANCPPTTPRDLRAYQGFVRALLVRYRNLVEYWEGWLEPNHRSFWPTGPNPQQYANLLSAEYQVFQSVNRRFGVSLELLFGGPADFSIIPGSSGGTAVLPFVDQTLNDLHGAHVFDGIALHGYRFPPATTGPWVRDWDSVKGIPPAPGSRGPFPAEGCDSSPWCQMSWREELTAYEQEFANHGYGRMPLWLTEFGWSGSAHAGGTYFPAYADQARALTAAYDDLLGLPFVQAAFWFNLRDYQPGLSNPDPDFFAHYGLLQYHFAPKPAASVFERLARAYPGR